MERIFTTKITSLRPQTDPRTGGIVESGELMFLIYTAKS